MAEFLENIEIFGASNPTELRIKNTKSIYSESFYFEDIYSDARVKRFIKSVERLVRNSEEYTEYLAYLHSSSDYFNRDNFLSNINDEVASIELHHYPFTLYEISEIVLNKNIMDNKKVTTFDVAKEIMDLHAKNLIGLIPLSITVHELAHTGRLNIHKDQIFGDYSTFMSIYNKAISADLKHKVDKMESQEGFNLNIKTFLQDGDHGDS